MYTADAISTLINRIRWNEPLESAFAVQLSDENKTGTSGKHFQRFHQLVSVENIYACVPDESMAESKFNALLSDLRNQAVRQVLTDIVDNNALSVPETDYSNIITANSPEFDNAIGYQVAISVLEMLLSSKRSNLHERNAKLSAANLKLELEGFMNEYGHTVAKGIRYYYDKAVATATRKIFPKHIIVQSINDAW